MLFKPLIQPSYVVVIVFSASLTPSGFLEITATKHLIHWVSLSAGHGQITFSHYMHDRKEADPGRGFVLEIGCACSGRLHSRRCQPLRSRETSNLRPAHPSFTTFVLSICAIIWHKAVRARHQQEPGLNPQKPKQRTGVGAFQRNHQPFRPRHRFVE